MSRKQPQKLVSDEVLDQLFGIALRKEFTITPNPDNGTQFRIEVRGDPLTNRWFTRAEVQAVLWQAISRQAKRTVATLLPDGA
jgi:hypothetical protein